MTEDQRRRLKAIKTFAQLVAFLRDDLDWPIERGHDEDDLTFDWSDDLGLKESERVGIKEIKQLRPLETAQPWGIFFVNFEKKRLPIVILRRILNALVMKKRASANRGGQRAAWQQHDLLFISAYGEDSDRQLTFAHFSEPAEELDTTKATLRVLGWDDEDTNLKLDYIADKLHEKLTWPKDPGDLAAWRKRWSEAFELRHRQAITTAGDLALRLAELAKRIRNRMLLVLPRESEKGELRKLLKGFKTALIHDLDDKQFADMYAQTITYGLFSARVSRHEPGEPGAVAQDDIVAMVPVTNPFLREMLSEFLKAGGRRRRMDFDELGIQEIVDLLRDPQTRLDAVLRDFGNRTRGEDPVIHFYEKFLEAYDKELKIQRGVFYTPQPVVSYIVRSVHELLQTELGLADGLADTTTWGEMQKRHAGLRLPPLTDAPGEKRTIPQDEPFVQILDPATGTATFLVEVIDVIYHTLEAKWKQRHLTDAQRRAAWNEYVPRHLLPRLHAFELMMAPYAIAHMKIGLKLAETGYRFGTEERARIYLTNALEPWVNQLPLIGFDALAKEAGAVNEIKRHKRFTVVIGNPPYAGHSSNNSEYAKGLVHAYRLVDGSPLGEKNPKWLQDDYVKFIRFAELVLARSSLGVLGYITNHSYSDNPTFRGMRRSLMKTFAEIRVLDLHGNTKKKEKNPDGSVDENVFDIQQGVAVVLGCVGTRKKETVVHADLWGTRKAKYARLAEKSFTSAEFEQLTPAAPFYLFIPQNTNCRSEYEPLPSVIEMFSANSMGVTTGDDDRFVGFAERELEEGLRGAGRVRAFAYRPFDTRVLHYDTDKLARARFDFMRHMVDFRNVALVTIRRPRSDRVANFFASNGLTDKCFISSLDNCQVLPLYVLPDNGALRFSEGAAPNLAAPFLKRLALTLRTPQEGEHGLPAGLRAEDIFHYAYAVFHSPGYRSRYAAFLKIDFPRLPLTGSLDLFRTLARLGGELTALHLLQSPKLDKPITDFVGGRNPEIEKPSHARNTVWVDKAQTVGFQGVREEVWNFHIGGYQVCEKWLKDRKGRRLSKDDIAHYQKIVVALSETIRLMGKIDEVIDGHGGWPGAFKPATRSD